MADPASDRGNARLQYFFLNGRWFRDRSLAHALQEAYRGLLMTHRYAVGFLFIEMPPDRVDVNDHPTKSEVRFRDAQAAFRLVLGGVRARLQAPSRRSMSERRFSTPVRGSICACRSATVRARR